MLPQNARMGAGEWWLAPLVLVFIFSHVLGSEFVPNNRKKKELS